MKQLPTKGKANSLTLLQLRIRKTAEAATQRSTQSYMVLARSHSPSSEEHNTLTCCIRQHIENNNNNKTNQQYTSDSNRAGAQINTQEEISYMSLLLFTVLRTCFQPLLETRYLARQVLSVLVLITLM